MDVTKLFESSEYIPPLESAKLETMIDIAISQPQIKKPANENKPWFTRAVAVAAAIIIALTVSLNLMPVQPATQDVSDAYEEITDLVIYETLNDLS